MVHKTKNDKRRCDDSFLNCITIYDPLYACYLTNKIPIILICDLAEFLLIDRQSDN